MGFWKKLIGRDDSNVGIQGNLPSQFNDHIKLANEIGALLPQSHLSVGLLKTKPNPILEVTIAFPRRISSDEVAQKFIDGLCDSLNLHKMTRDQQMSALLPAPEIEISNFVIYLHGGKNTDGLINQLLYFRDMAGNATPEINALIRDYNSKSHERIPEADDAVALSTPVNQAARRLYEQRQAQQNNGASKG